MGYNIMVDKKVYGILEEHFAFGKEISEEEEELLSRYFMEMHQRRMNQPEKSYFFRSEKGDSSIHFKSLKSCRQAAAAYCEEHPFLRVTIVKNLGEKEFPYLEYILKGEGKLQRKRLRNC